MWRCDYDVAVVMLQSCYSYISVSTEQQERQMQTELEMHRKKEVEIAIQQKALKNKKNVYLPLI